MVSQMVFAERCLLLEEGEDQWVRIRTVNDGYEGWCQQQQLEVIGNGSLDAYRYGLTKDWVSDLLLDGELIKVPYGVQVPIFHGGKGQWGIHEFEFRGKFVVPGEIPFTEENIRKLASPFLHTGYLWGGKTVFGTDCSGFTQTVFQFFGIQLLRDAWQQAGQGVEVKDLASSQCGDLAFFINQTGKVTHVGILLDPSSIIHASSFVRIDEIDHEGIRSRKSGEHTHRLSAIRRYR
jgi:cell wall-associated NlpC family hydrolase